mgnify:CR=1 FL=1
MIICDTHCDTLYMRALQPDHTPCVTMEAMKKGGMSLQTCTLFAGSQGIEGHPYEKAMAEFVSAVAQNKALGEELRQCVTQFANLLVAMQAQMNAMQRDLQSKVTISTAQAKAIQDAVKGRSTAICSAKGLSYERSGKALRAAIYRDFCKEFAVASRHDLPANKFRSAVEFVEEWSSLSLVRRLREKEKESDAEKGNAGRCR